MAMNIYKSIQWQKDVMLTAENSPELGYLSGKIVMITGAAGLVCSPIVDIILSYNDSHTEKAPIQIIAAGRWIEEMKSRFHDHTSRSDFKYVRYDASKTDNILPDDLNPDYIIHGASNASPDLLVKEPVETMLSNVMGIYSLLELARKHHTKRVLYVSSSEVYGLKEGNEPYRESEYGFIDQLVPRNSYSVGKRAAENMCVGFASEYGMETVIVRPGHIYGPTASERDVRVASAFAWAAARGNNLIMKSDGKQLRSYCHCLDCASAILKILLCGKNGHAYNISNQNSIITIRQMAEELAKAGDVELIIEKPTETEKVAFNPMSNSSLDSKSLENLGWKGIFDAPTGLAHTVKVMREMLQ